MGFLGIGRRVRFLGIGRRVRFQGIGRRVRFLGIGRRVEVGKKSASDRYMDCLSCPKLGPAPARCVRCPTGHQPYINRFYVRVKS